MQIYILTTTRFKCPYIENTRMFYICMYVLYCIAYVVYILCMGCVYVCVICVCTCAYVHVCSLGFRVQCIVLHRNVMYCIELYRICCIHFLYALCVCMCYVCVYVHIYVMYCISCLFMYELNCNTLFFAFTFSIHFFPFPYL